MASNGISVSEVRVIVRNEEGRVTRNVPYRVNVQNDSSTRKRNDATDLKSRAGSTKNTKTAMPYEKASKKSDKAYNSIKLATSNSKTRQSGNITPCGSPRQSGNITPSKNGVPSKNPTSNGMASSVTKPNQKFPLRNKKLPQSQNTAQSGDSSSKTSMPSKNITQNGNDVQSRTDLSNRNSATPRNNVTKQDVKTASRKESTPPSTNLRRTFAPSRNTSLSSQVMTKQTRNMSASTKAKPSGDDGHSDKVAPSKKIETNDVTSSKKVSERQSSGQVERTPTNGINSHHGDKSSIKDNSSPGKSLPQNKNPVPIGKATPSENTVAPSRNAIPRTSAKVMQSDKLFTGTRRVSSNKFIRQDRIEPSENISSKAKSGLSTRELKSKTSGEVKTKATCDFPFKDIVPIGNTVSNEEEEEDVVLNEAMSMAGV